MKTILILTMSAIISGCGTSLSRFGGTEEAVFGDPYAGTKCSIELVEVTATTYKTLWLLLPFAIVDTVFSIVIDTVLLPVDIPIQKKSGLDACNTGSLSP